MLVTMMGLRSVLLLIMVLFLSNTESKKSKPIIASLTAKWKITPLPLEASEFMAEESNELFWKFINDFPVSDETNQRNYYDWSLEEVQRYLKVSDESPKIKLLKFALALRLYSPKIEMFNQLALDAPAPSCDEFYEVRGRLITCSWTEMKKAVEEDTGDAPILYKQDHIYPGSKADFNKTVIMYANFISTTMPDLHNRLVEMAEKHKIQYVLRHWIRARPDGSVRLSGYGVELALKKTEYKAVDDSELKDNSGKAVTDEDQDEEIEGFDFKILRSLNSDLSSQLTDFRNHLQESTNEMSPMKAWQLQDLSFQAAARVLSSPKNEQLQVLKDISQNFPLRARSLTKQQVSDELRKEVQKNQKHSFSNGQLESDHALLINGIPIDLETTDIYTIFDIIRSESRIMDGLSYFNIPETSMKSFQLLNIKSKTDANYLDIRDPAVIWLNDIESDQKYRQWPTNLHELLRPAFPGSMRRLRKNWCHLVFVIDPTTPEMAQLIETAEALWANEIPVRIGFVFVVNDAKDVDGREDAGVGIIRAYNFAKNELSTDEAFTFLTGIYKSLDEGATISSEHVISRINKKFPGEDLELILGERSDWDDGRKLGKSFLGSSGLSGDVNVLMNGELFSEDELTEDAFEDAVIEKVFDATRHLQRAVYMAEVDGGKKLLDFFMERPEVVPRFNDVILKDEPKFIDFQEETGEETEYWDSKKFKQFSNPKQTATIAEFIKKSYISKSDSSTYIRSVTMWVVTDVETKYGRQLVQNAFKHVKSSSLSRIGIIHNPTTKESRQGIFIKAIEATLATQLNNNARNFITKITKEENAEAIESGLKKLSDFYVGGMDEELFEQTFQQSTKVLLPHVGSHSAFARSVLGLVKGGSAVVANGRVIALKSEIEFVPADFKLLETVIYSSSAQMIKETLESEDLTTDNVADASDLIMKMTALLATQPPLETERQSLKVAGAQHSAIVMESRDEDTPAFEIIAVLDPATEEAQQIAPLISVLYDVINTKVTIYMNCKEKLSDMPVKRFYRYVLDTEPKFKNSNFLYDGPLAKFSDMPSKTLLTMTIFPPEGWMVAPVKAIYDLDNIKLEEVSSTSVVAEYQLEHLLLEGHASDVMTGSRPGGLQFTLGTKTNPLLVDTIVMANLGYFQMKANPGAWFLRLREGKSRDVYDITGHLRTDSPPDNNNITVLMDSFKSRVIMVKVSKKPDKLDEDLLDDDKTAKKEESPGIWDSIANTLTGGAGTASATEGSGDVLNIFSLASGHLYERLMRIMIVSVLRTSKAKVKFWILKNYLSPDFKDFIPKMAEKYDFEYELVQYKWPTWLNQQKEKQRTMWGYKILFLDVLFPLGVEKIIFVDADQIVRADLRELRDLDLEGNPYGYTPFCDDRTNMDGFRFWKSGYWKQHLAGRKYHISAIYVVDLKKFRRIAAGDRLRGQYQGLSQDPNSLSNLDQDLPNNMIHQVGIKSLPQEWLWCETWCSDGSKSAAKTIDLCNNPQTKESKLSAAVRIVPEWTEYDNEIKALQKELEEKNQTNEKKEENVDAKKTTEPSHDEF